MKHTRPPVRAIASLLVLGAVAVALASPLAESRPGSLRIVERLSAERQLAPGEVAAVTVNCPSRYLAIGGMEFMGAIDLVASASTTSRRGWTVAGGNPNNETYKFAAGVICAKGSGSVRVRKASAGQLREALRAYERRLAERR